MNKRGLAPASGAVEGFFKSQELASALRPHLAKVHWEGVVGPQVARVTQVEAARNGILFVRVEAGPWFQEMMWLKDDILRRLNAKLGGQVLTEVRFNAGILDKPEDKPETARPAAPTDAELGRVTLSKAAVAQIETTLREITDEALRGRIRGIMLRAAQTEEWKRRQGWPVCGRCGALSEPLPPPDPAPYPHSKPLCTVCRAVVFGLGR